MTAILLHRYRGNPSPDALSKQFIHMRNGVSDLHLLWIEDPQRQLVPVDQIVEDLSPCSGSEGSWNSEESEAIVEDVTDSDIERSPQELENIEQFKQKVAAHAKSKGKPMPILKQLLRKKPFAMNEADDRFNKRQTDMVFACDSCGQLVSYSRMSTNSLSRADAAFLGSYIDSSWKDLPGEFRKEAWELGLIDASWFCTTICKNPPTGREADPSTELGEIAGKPTETLETCLLHVTQNGALRQSLFVMCLKPTRS